MSKSVNNDKRVEYVLPKHMFGTDDYHTVVFNGVAYQIKKGELVHIPAGVAEILDHAIEGEAAVQDLMEQSGN